MFEPVRILAARKWESLRRLHRGEWRGVSAISHAPNTERSVAGVVCHTEGVSAPPDACNESAVTFPWTVYLANMKHGHAAGKGSPEYASWKAMLQRCSPLSKTTAKNRRYKELEVRVCTRWKRFENFLADMGPRPPGCSLDRFPNGEGNYEPGNVRWATAKEQALNTSRNRMVTVAGVTLPLSAMVERLGLSMSTVRSRLKRGHCMETALCKKPLPLKDRPRNDSNKSNSKRIIIGGVERHLAEWLRQYGLTKEGFYDRVRRGMNEVEALTTPSRRSRERCS